MAEVKFPDAAVAAEKELYDIKRLAIRDVKNYIADAQRTAGFPKEKDDYTVFLKQGRREARRDIDKVSPTYLSIGTQRSPTSFVIRANVQNIEEVREAVRWIYTKLKHEGPSRTGEYLRNVRITASNEIAKGVTEQSVVTYGGVEKAEISPGGFFQIYTTAQHSLFLEAGYFTGWMKNNAYKNRGIMYQIAKDARSKFRKIAIRFTFVESTMERWMLPAIQVGFVGTFRTNEVDVRPGKHGVKRRNRYLKRRYGG